MTCQADDHIEFQVTLEVPKGKHDHLMDLLATGVDFHHFHSI